MLAQHNKPVTVEYQPLTLELWHTLGFEFPQEAIDEMRDVWRQSANRGVMESIADSLVCEVAFINGRPIFIYGVCPDDDSFPDERLYNVWGFSSIDARRYPKTMVVEGRKIVEKLRSMFGWMFAWCDPRYKRSMKWLDMIGIHDTGDHRPIVERGLIAAKLETDKTGR